MDVRQQLDKRVAADLRRAVFDHVLALSPAFFETARTGDILSRLTADIGVLQSLIGSAISQGLRSTLMAIGAVLLLVATSAKLAGVVLLVVPVVVAPLILFGRREKALSRLAQDRIADLGARAEETINGIRTVQAFNHEARESARFGEDADAAAAAALRRIASRGAQILVVILLGLGAITFSLWIGGQDVVAGRMSGGELSAFMFYAVLLASSGATVSELWGEVQRAAGAADRLLAVPPAIAAGLRQPGDLANQVLIQQTTWPCGLVEWLEQAVVDGVDGLRGPLLQHTAMVAEACAAGLGVGLLPRFLVEREVAEGRLSMPFARTLAGDAAYCLAYPEAVEEVPALRAFRDCLLAQVEA